MAHLSPDARALLLPVFGFDPAISNSEIIGAVGDAARGIGVDHAPALAGLFAKLREALERLNDAEVALSRAAELAAGQLASLHSGFRHQRQPSALSAHVIELERQAGIARRADAQRARYLDTVTDLVELVGYLNFHLTGTDEFPAVFHPAHAR